LPDSILEQMGYEVKGENGGKRVVSLAEEGIPARLTPSRAKGIFEHMG
jgi:hypothetical protein